MSRKPGYQPAQSRALEYLRDEVARARTSARSHLPSARTLARLCGVSLQTMQHACDSLRANGELISRPRVGLYLAAQSETSTAVPPPLPLNSPRSSSQAIGPRSHQVYKAMLSDILTGTLGWPEEPFPTLSELGERYGCGYRSLREALSKLCDQKRLVRYRRSFRATSPGAARAMSTVLFVSSIGDMHQLSNYTVRSQEFWRTLDRVRLQRGFDIETVQCSPPSRGRSELAVVREKLESSGRTLLGSIVWSGGYTQSQAETLIAELSAIKGHTVAFLDEFARLSTSGIAARFTRNPRVQCFNCATSALCGERVADFLIGRDHSHIAFFSPCTNDPCYGTRFDGIRERFESATGKPRSVRPFILGESSEAVHALVRVQSPYREMLQSLDSLRIMMADAQAVQAPLIQLESASTAVWLAFLRRAMTPLFESALVDLDISAWVCVNDELALVAQEFLAARHQPAPKQVLVVGFDDTVEALGAGLTSYSFNVPALVHRMVEHILRPQMRAAGAQESVIEIEGTVVARATTA